MLAIKTILCPTDFSEPSNEGLKYAIELATLFGADLCVTNIVPAVPPLPIDPTFVFPIPEYERELRADSERKLRELIEQVPKNLKVRTVIGYGDAGKEIVRIAEDERADLIVQLYANHYFEGSLALTWLVDAEAQAEKPGCYLIYLNRSRMDALRGAISWLKRSLSRGRIRDGLVKNLQLTKETLEARRDEP